jgi:hypothetical protein
MFGTLLQSFGLVKTLRASKRSFRGAKSGSPRAFQPDRGKRPTGTQTGLTLWFPALPSTRGCRLKSAGGRAPAVAHLTEQFIVSSIAPAQIAA